jgi:hypothetical protein
VSDSREQYLGVRRFGPSGLLHGWIGLLLIAICWPLNWYLPGLRTHLLFFPLWLGYALAVDALVLRRSGTSLLARSPRDFAILFVVSAPAWWLFEVLNWRTMNWEYQGRELFGDLEFFLLASLSFSTVMPAVFGTAELMRTFGWIERFARGPRIGATLRTRVTFFLVGCLMLGLLVAWPRYFFGFMWLSLFFILDPICLSIRRPSILTGLARGDWRTVVALSTGTLACGLLWELWNFFSYPKWVYHVPFIDRWHVFEMPLLGYLGYLPFGLELYALAHLLQRRTPLRTED